MTEPLFEYARSKTAEGTAMARAAAALDSDPAARNPDHLAEHLIAPRLRALLRNEVTRQEAVQHMERLAPGMYLYMLARTRHFDALLASELARGVKQFVILGAGLDSRAHRFAAQLNAATVFEVDHPIHAINGQSTKALR